MGITRKGKTAKTLKTNLLAWLLLLPSLLFLSLFTFFPIIKTIYLSFFEMNLSVSEPVFSGWRNYRILLEDEVFYQVLKNTFIMVFGTVPTSIALGMLMAVCVNKMIKNSGWVRTMFFYPTVIPMIAIANFWLFIYTPDYGLLSHVLGVFQLPDMNWLGSSSTVLPAMIVMMIWKESGFFMIFYLAGLQNISRDLYESAALDGASKFHTFRRITFPLLMPTTLFVMIISVTNAFKIVDHIVIMTEGGPNNASSVLLYYIYETGFEFWDQGMAATLTVVLVLILLLIACAKFFGLEKKIHYS